MAILHSLLFVDGRAANFSRFEAVRDADLVDIARIILRESSTVTEERINVLLKS